MPKNQPEHESPHRRRPNTGRVLIDFLGSMNLAITLLVALAIASAIGTILQQNQPYADYVIKFGPFWFEVFKTLGLYDVYSAGWFLGILAFLLISTSACVTRNAPLMLREMRQYRTNVQEKSLRMFHHHRELRIVLPMEQTREALNTYLGSRGFRSRQAAQDGAEVLAARKGNANRWGYIFAHTAIVVICIGGLLDSKLHLKLAEMTGNLALETRNLPASEVPEISRVGEDNHAYRGNVNIPEGGRSGVLFLTMRDGYVVQELPFEIELQDFRVEHYDNGQPKSYESDLLIHDPEHLDEPLASTISVNHPLIYRGNAIYQASFADGGSRLDLQSWQLVGRVGAAQELQAKVFGDYPFRLQGEDYTLEINDFRLFNINPVENEEGKEEQVNFGPSYRYKIRDAAGQALEFETFMSPVTFDGRRYFLSGMRAQPGEPFRYLHIPADRQGKIDTFMTFLSRLHDTEYMRSVAEKTVGVATPSPAVREQVVGSMTHLLDLFLEKGYDGIGLDIEQKVPEAEREKVFEAYVKVLQTALGTTYVDLLREQGRENLEETDWLFLEDAVNAINALTFYGAPVFIQLSGFEQVQASGLQITKSPGKDVVYFGSVLLTLGVFIMFYIHQRRYWFHLRQEDGETVVLVAGNTNRASLDFDREFDTLCNELETKLPSAGRRDRL